MRTVNFRILVTILIAAILSSCGPSKAELDTTATQIAANIFATQTATAPTATPTFTPSPPPTATLTVTPSPSPTADITVREEELVERVSALMDVMDAEGALNLCTETINADPSFAMGFTVRGFIFLGNQDFEAAVRDFDKAIELGIIDNLDKEIDSGVTVKTIYYFRGVANLELGAYQQGIEDLERFLDVTEPLEYPELRADAQYQLADWQLGPEPVSSGQQFNFTYFSIVAPKGQDWGSQQLGAQMIKFWRLDRLNDQEDIYSERSTVGIASAESLNMDYSKDDFLQFVCSNQVPPESRYQILHEYCDWSKKTSFDCVYIDGQYEDYGGSDLPYSPPLIMDGYSLVCRHPNSTNIMIFLHYSQRGPEGSLDDDIEQQAEEFFSGLSFNQPEE